jgi:uncharacterized iron-regulated membrane protein
VDGITGTELHKAMKRSRANWLRSPQRVFLRRAIFQVHLWLGILLALYSIVIGITGSALVFEEEIARATQPGLYHIAPGPQQVTLDEAIRRIQAARPGWTVFALEDFAEPERATTALLRSAGAKPTPNFRTVSFNPHTGQVLSDHLRYAGVMGWLGNLHVYLLSGSTGLLVSGWMGVGLLLLCLSGLILWWPGVRRWAAALVINSKAGWRRLNWDLHTVIGFWTSVALIVIIFTGVDFAFPGPVGRIVEIATGSSFSSRAGSPEAMKKLPITGAASVITVDQAIAAAYRVLPKDAPPGYFQLPSRAGSPYTVIGYYTGVAPYSRLVRISLDPYTGEALSFSDTRQQTRGQRIQQYFVAIHFGSFAGNGVFGTLVKVVWVLLGIVLALLAVTGLVMYWNRKLRPVWRHMTNP